MSTTITSAMPQSTKNACSPFARGAIIRGERCEYWDPNDSQALQPLRWKRPRMIFVCAHGDLFRESVPKEWIDRVFAVMALAPQHTFQVLTKRSKRMREYLFDPRTIRRVYEIMCDFVLDEQFPVVLMLPGVDDPGICPKLPRIVIDTWPLPNVWLGVSVEDQKRADERIPDLLATPAAIRFTSAEPLLGPVDLEQCGTLETIQAALPAVIEYEMRGRARAGNGSICDAKIDAVGNGGSSLTFYKTPDHMGGFSARSPRAFPRLDWVIVGGESGPGARPMHPDWARSIRDQCAAAGVPFFFKQWGEWSAYNQMTDGGVFDLEVNERPYYKWIDPTVLVHKVGKARAGRRLDGVEHNGIPEGR